MKDFRLGLYGGTFSPPHSGHVAAAEAFVSQFGLDKLLIMPTSIPPHKAIPRDDDPHHRLNMTRLAFASICEGGKAEVSELELRRGGKSYTSDTLRELYGIYGLVGDHAVYMLVGTDMLLTLSTWHEACDIFRMASVVYVCRNDGDDGVCEAKREEYERELGARIYKLDVDTPDVSSTEARALIKSGADTRGVIPEAVAEYIKEAGLYV